MGHVGHKFRTGGLGPDTNVCGYGATSITNVLGITAVNRPYIELAALDFLHFRRHAHLGVLAARAGAADRGINVRGDS